MNVADDFKPLYVVSADKRATIRSLKSKLADADELILATDEDREGEAIAWHLLQELKPKVPYSRMVFHEITPEAIRAAAENLRELDTDLVDAQEHRILDRLYRCEVSPVLWKKVMPKLSAGECGRRHPTGGGQGRNGWPSGTPPTQMSRRCWRRTTRCAEFRARVSAVEGSRIAGGRDFTSEGGCGAGPASSA